MRIQQSCLLPEETVRDLGLVLQHAYVFFETSDGVILVIVASAVPVSHVRPAVPVTRRRS